MFAVVVLCGFCFSLLSFQDPSTLSFDIFKISRTTQGQTTKSRSIHKIEYETFKSTSALISGLTLLPNPVA